MKFTITQKELKKLSACCANKHREQLQNIFCTVKGGRVELAATDGNILAVMKKDAELGETPEEFKTCIPSDLYKKFNAKAHIEISSTEEKDKYQGTYKAYDLISGSQIFYTAPTNPARPNYEAILKDLEGAKTAEDYAIFLPDVLKKIENLLGPLAFSYTVPRTLYNYRPHFWVVDDLIIAAMPCRP